MQWQIISPSMMSAPYLSPLPVDQSKDKASLSGPNSALNSHSRPQVPCYWRHSPNMQKTLNQSKAIKHLNICVRCL